MFLFHSSSHLTATQSKAFLPDEKPEILHILPASFACSTPQSTRSCDISLSKAAIT
jgi:hypothetical protein